MALTRRAFIARVAGLTVLSVDLTTARAQAAAEKEVSFRWTVPTAHYQTVEDALVFDGEIKEQTNTKGLPLFVFVGIALLPSLADAILTLRRKLVQPGLKIDARGSEIKIEVDSNLPRGTILLVDASGAKLHEPDQLTDPVELAKALAAAMSK